MKWATSRLARWGSRGRGVAVAAAGVAVIAVAALLLGAVPGVPGVPGVLGVPRAPWVPSASPSTYVPVTPTPPPEADLAPAGPVFQTPTAHAAGPDEPTVYEVLSPTLAAFDGRVGVSVIDLSSGVTAYEAGATVAQTPASTLKILTAIAALEVLGPEHTFGTRVLAPPSDLAQGGQVTLVGGGDPTLTAADAGSGGRLTQLADATADALNAAGVSAVTLAFDDSLFSGSPVDPDWSPGYVPSDVVSPVSALAADVADDRPQEPAFATAETFAALLEGRGIAVESSPIRAVADPGMTEVATVVSPLLATIVEDMLTSSDNDAAEVLARHVAVERGHPGTSADASVAVEQTLASLGLDMTTSRLLDGSGLARGSVVPAATVAAALALAADSAHPQLRPVVTGLPVAAFSGTLADRLDDADGTAGVVRAKTGTLTGVSSLAGVLVSQDGSSYAFAVLADDVSNTGAARAALDGVAAALTTCGCR